MHSQKISQLNLFMFRTAKASGHVSYFCALKDPKKCCVEHGQISHRIQMAVILKILRDIEINKHFPIKKA